MNGEFLITDDNGVARICSAVVSDDYVMVRGQEVDDLSLAFIGSLEPRDSRMSLQRHLLFPGENVLGASTRVKKAW